MSRHLGSLASDYVDRRLPPAHLTQLDRHVLACPACRATADEERALLTVMRTVPPPSVSPSLRESLLGLAAGIPDPSPAPTGATAVPEAPAAVQPTRLPVVRPAAPALHRSPFRATVLAGLAASASAAVAWGLAAPAGPAASAPTLPSSRSSATLVRATVPPASVVSFTGAQTILGRPALTERLGR